jgi:hypothetical protein
MIARRGIAVLAATWLLAGLAWNGPRADEGTLDLSVEPRQATVGDHLEAKLTLDLPDDAVPELREIGPRVGPFAVISGSWSGPEPVESGQRWTWAGQLSAYRTGELELPPLAIRFERNGETGELSSESVVVEMLSVLGGPAATEEAAEIADLKPPASVPADYRALWAGLGLLGLLLAGALALWWLQRRYAARLAAARIPEDPFHRTPPHEWVYRELQALLKRRLEEQGRVDLFFSELSRILKLYLGGRYRVDLMERTTEELPPVLRQAGAPETGILAAGEFLARCDRVKFAGERPGPERSREAVEQAYRLVDLTRPAAIAGDSQSKGAA